MAKVALIFGTRPDAIKMAPLVKEFAAVPTWDVRVIVTGQHREMLDQVLELFAIKPDYDFNIMTEGQTLSDITTKVIQGMDQVFAEWLPDWIFVHGDTTTALAGALAGFYRQIPVAHVEAGLRTNSVYSPFPEEANRRITDVITTLYLAPTQRAAENLLAEGVASERIHVTGNTVIDALLQVVDEAYQFQDPILKKLDFSIPTILATVHRRENWGDPLERICGALQEIVTTLPVQVVFAMHKNPRIKKVVRDKLGMLNKVYLTEAPPYQEFANLMNKSTLLLTDSGGLQEEAPALGKPVFVLRESTERPEGIEAGTIKLVGTDKEDIVKAVTNIITDRQIYEKMARSVNPYGDGHASYRICNILKQKLAQRGDRDGNQT